MSLTLILTTCVATFLFFYVAAKNKFFEKLFASQFVFDPKELDKIVKSAVKKYPDNFKVDQVGEMKINHSDETTVCTLKYDGCNERKWTRETPDMDGKFNEPAENPNAIFELRCEEILRQLHEKYPKYCADMKSMDFFDSKKMKEQWMFNMCGVSFKLI